MARTIADTASDLDVMEHAIKRMNEVIFAKPYFRSMYDDALARVESDLGDDFRIMRGMKLEPEDLIHLGRTAIQSIGEPNDVPQTCPPGGHW